MKDVAELLAAVARHASPDEAALVKAAATFAERCHRGYVRDSGTPHFAHAVEVAHILHDWHAPPEIVAAALLHDVLNPRHADVRSSTTFRRAFPQSVASLVEDVTLLGKLGPALPRVPPSGPTNREREMPSGERFSWATAILQRDPWAIVIKVAAQLHSARGIAELPPDQQERFAALALNVFAPLAGSLGMQSAKETLEETAFRIQNPKRYQNIDQLYGEVPGCVQMDDLITDLRSILDQHQVQALASKRLRSRYDIFRRQLAYPGQELAPADVAYIVVVVQSVEDCYRALGVVHSIWHPLGQVYDSINSPERNGYRALHTRVHASDLGTFLVVIRTDVMQTVADYGITAQWRGVGQELLPTIEPLSKRPDGCIMAITPKGEVVYLPESATPIDFAYAIHTEIGHKCMEALVNGTQASLIAPLPDGAVVDIIVSRGPMGPSAKWLEYVVTATAKEAIEKWTRLRCDAELLIEGRDRVGLLKDVCDIIADHGINIIYAHVDRIEAGDAPIRIGLQQVAVVALDELIRALKETPQITRVTRRELSLVPEGQLRPLTRSRSGNPYSINTPALGRIFKGREREIQEISERFRGSDHDNTLLLWGQRHIGKTSLLLHLEREVLQDKTSLIVYLSLQDGLFGQPISHFLHRIAYVIENKVQRDEVKAPKPQRLRKDPIYFFQQFIDRLAETMETQNLLIMLDEFQGIGTLKEEGTTTRRDLFASFRGIVQHFSTINFLFCGGGVPQHLLDQSGLASLLALVDPIRIDRLTPEAATSVIVDLDPSLDYEPRAVQRLLYVADFHPYYLTALCSMLYASRTRQKITLEDIEAVITRSMEWHMTLEGWLEHYWTMDLANVALGDRHRAVLTALATGLDSSGWTTFERVAELVHRDIGERDVWESLSDLRDYGSIIADGQNYRIPLPLLEQWLRAHPKLRI